MAKREKEEELNARDRPPIGVDKDEAVRFCWSAAVFLLLNPLLLGLRRKSCTIGRSTRR